MASDKHMEAAQETYSAFVSIIKWGTISTAAIVAFVVFLIA